MATVRVEWFLTAIYRSVSEEQDKTEESQYINRICDPPRNETYDVS